MTQEDKQLLLKDISARLPYGVKCIVTKSKTEEGQKGDVGKIRWVSLEGVDCIGDREPFFSEFGNFKPYLFPLSTISNRTLEMIDEWSDAKTIYATMEIFNSRHIDYRGLIEKGLAIDATGLNIY